MQLENSVETKQNSMFNQADEVDTQAFIQALGERFTRCRGRRSDDELFGIAWSTDASNE
jgi:hypothetical protein